MHYKLLIVLCLVSDFLVGVTSLSIDHLCPSFLAIFIFPSHSFKDISLSQCGCVCVRALVFSSLIFLSWFSKYIVALSHKGFSNKYMFLLKVDRLLSLKYWKSPACLGKLSHRAENDNWKWAVQFPSAEPPQCSPRQIS